MEKGNGHKIVAPENLLSCVKQNVYGDRDMHKQKKCTTLCKLNITLTPQT
jgi:hypothetical protein